MDKDIVGSLVLFVALGGYVVMVRGGRPGGRVAKLASSIDGMARDRRPGDPAIAKLAASIDQMRAVTAREPAFQPMPAGATLPPPLSEYYDASTRDIEQAGCRALGDLAEQRPDGTLTPPMRWFVDDTGTTCGWFGVAGTSSGAARQVTYLFSEAASGEYYITSRGGVNSSTAGPPTEHRAECAWADGLTRQLQVHRAAIPAQAASSLTHIATLDDATGLTRRVRAAKNAWRAKQPQDALLQQDLQQILQDRYPTFGAPLLAYMRNRPPGS